MFLAISSVIGKTESEVAQSLANYVGALGGGLKEEAKVESERCNYCVVSESDGNTSIVYPHDFFDWERSSQFISKELNAPVFSFHIHDGDLWMYILYKGGEIIDQFNPIPDYWDDSLTDEEIDSWRGDAKKLAGVIPYIQVSDIDRYLVRWPFDDEPTAKAYPTDEFVQGDWQLVDFMKKLRQPFPIDENDAPLGSIYKLWMKQPPHQINTNKPQPKPTQEKPWWKFW